MRRLPAALLVLSVAAGENHVSPMAGRWYPADAGALESAIEKSIGLSKTRTGAISPRKGLVALVVPHAGIEYSGAVAASAYRLIGRPANIIVLAFSHRVPLDGVVAPKVSSYTTPAGEIRVNQAALDSLGFPRLDERALCDHSLENQLPLIRKLAPEATITPLYVGTLDAVQLREAAAKLESRLRQGDLLVASSDFTHYGRAYGHTPFAQDQELKRKLGERLRESFEQVGSLDVDAFDRYLSATGDTICGRDPLRLLMAALDRARGNIYMTVADAMHSAELTNDWGQTVGYGALAFYPASSYGVGPGEQKLLLEQSRAALEAHYQGAKPALRRSGLHPDLDQRTSLFVTLKKEGALRGCVGDLAPRAAVLETTAERTIAAARSDPRFPALRRDEGAVSIEVSLLTPLKRLSGWREFRSGHGAVLVHGSRGGLLLPQVASEMGWNREQFLEGLSTKAGLGPKAYRDPGAKLYVFEAQVFSEAPTERRAGGER